MTTEQLIKKFNDKYKVTMFDIEATKAQKKKFKYVDDFIMNKKTQSPEISVYVDGLTNLLTEYISNKTKMDNYGTYNFSNFNLKEFIDEYEEIVSSNAKDNNLKRKPYENVTYKSLVEHTIKSIEPLNKPISNLWAKNVLDKKMTIREMERLTDHANEVLNGMHLTPNKIKHMRNLMEKKNYDGMGAKEKEDALKEQRLAHNRFRDVKMILTNLVLAKNTMKQVRGNRSGFWKFFKRQQNNAEKEYLAKLERQIDTLASKGYPISEVLLENYKPILKTPVEEMQKVLETEKNKAIAPAKPVEQPVQFSVPEVNNAKVNDVHPPVKQEISKNPPTNIK